MVRRFLDRWARQLVRRGIRAGLIEGSNLWLSIGALAWLFRFLSKHQAPEVSTESLRLGESVIVSHVPAPPRTRRARIKAARKTDKAERREAKAQKKREASRRYAKATAKNAAAAAAQQAAEEERLAREKARGKNGRRRRRKDKSAARLSRGAPAEEPGDS